MELYTICRGEWHSPLLDMAVLRKSCIIYFVSYPADKLYILTENQATTVSSLLDFGKKWRADVVDIIDSINQEYAFRLQQSLKARYTETLMSENKPCQLDAVVISSWWD